MPPHAESLILDYVCKKPQSNRGYAEGLRLLRYSCSRQKNTARSKGRLRIEVMGMISTIPCGDDRM
jgi:hypothetical protein